MNARVASVEPYSKQRRITVDREQSLPTAHDLAHRRHARERRTRAVHGSPAHWRSRAPPCRSRARAQRTTPRPCRQPPWPHRRSPTAARTRPAGRRSRTRSEPPPDPAPPAAALCAALSPVHSMPSCCWSAASVARRLRERRGITGQRRLRARQRALIGRDRLPRLRHRRRRAARGQVDRHVTGIAERPADQAQRGQRPPPHRRQRARIRVVAHAARGTTAERVRSRPARRQPRQPAARSPPARAGGAATTRSERQRTRAPHRRLSSGSRASSDPNAPTDQERDTAPLRLAEQRRGGVNSAAPNHEPDPAAGSRGRIGEIGNAMRTHAPREQQAAPPQHRPAAPGSARRRRTPPRRRSDLDEDKWRPDVLAPEMLATPRPEPPPQPAIEDRHAGERDESREGARAPAQAVASSHGIGCSHAGSLLRFDVLNLVSPQAQSCDRDPSNPDRRSSSETATRRPSPDCSRVLTSVSKRRVSLPPWTKRERRVQRSAQRCSSRKHKRRRACRAGRAGHSRNPRWAGPASRHKQVGRAFGPGRKRPSCFRHSETVGADAKMPVRKQRRVSTKAVTRAGY